MLARAGTRNARRLFMTWPIFGISRRIVACRQSRRGATRALRQLFLRSFLLGAALFAICAQADAEATKSPSSKQSARQPQKVRVKFTRYFMEQLERTPDSEKGVRYTFKNSKGRKET